MKKSLKKSSNKIGLRIIAILAIILLSFWGIDYILEFISAPNTGLVMLGFILLLAMIFLWIYMIPKFIIGIRKSIKESKQLAKEIKAESPLFVLVIITLLISLQSCTFVKPGHVGIKINNFGTYKGVSDLPLKTGAVWYNFLTTNVFDYPTFVQTAVWTKDVTEGAAKNEEMTFNTSEGTNVSGDISLSYELIADSVPHFYLKFRSDDLDKFTHGFLRNVARDAFNELGGRYKLENLYGIDKEKFLTEVKIRVNSQVGMWGVKIVQLGFVGSLRMAPEIMTALNNKLKQVQDAIAAENKLRQIDAEAQQKISAAKGIAESNRILAASITSQLIAWENLQISRIIASKWNGIRPLVESGGNNGLLLQLPQVGLNQQKSAYPTTEKK